MANSSQSLTATTLVGAPMGKVWHFWTAPKHMAQWNNTSEDWQTPHAENDVRPGGTLFLRMEKKDGSAGFDYRCTYDKVIVHKELAYTASDQRKTTIQFDQCQNGVALTEIFEPDATTPLDLQETFCQSILDNFKRYVENTYDQHQQDNSYQ